MKRPIGPLLFVLAAFLIFSACAGIAGLKQTPRDIQENALQELLDRWEDYRIFVTLWRGGQVRAMLFNFRDQDKRILVERWVPVQNKEDLSRLMVQIKSGQSPRLFTILGPQEKSFGYLYAPNTDIQIRVVNDQTLRVFEIKPPPSPAL